MAKRELSSNLKNMKFMQRATLTQKVEKKDKEEIVIVEENVISSTVTLNRKCIVTMEGNPHPGALKGRMSFQSFNPSIDKLNKEAEEDLCEPQMPTASSVNQIGRNSERANGFSQSGLENMTVDDDFDEDLKRKKPEMGSPFQSQRNLGNDRSQSSADNRGSKQRKHEKLDWCVLMPDKAQTKMG